MVLNFTVMMMLSLNKLETKKEPGGILTVPPRDYASFQLPNTISGAT